MSRRSWRCVLLAVPCLSGASVSAQVDAPHDVGYVLRTDFDRDGRDDLLIRTRWAWHGWFGRSVAPWFAPGREVADVRPMPVGAPVVGDDGLVHEPSVADAPVGSGIEVRTWRPRADGSVQLVETVRVGRVTEDRSATAPVLLPMPDAGGGVLLAWSELSVTAPALLRAAVLRSDHVPQEVTLPLDGPAPQGLGWMLRAARWVDRDGLLGLTGDHAQLILAGQAGDLAALSVQVTATASGVPEPTGFRAWRGTPPLMPDEFRRTLGGVARGHFARTPAFGGLALVGWDGWLLGVPADFRPPWAQLPGTVQRVPDSLRLLHGASGDYDGDGAEEAVGLVAGPRGRFDLLLLLDPYPHALRAQGLVTPPGQPAWFGGSDFAVRHGAPADIDGDGRLDLALVLLGAAPGRSRLALLRGVIAGDGRRGLQAWW